jgi:hypothetical protein
VWVLFLLRAIRSAFTQQIASFVGHHEGDRRDIAVAVMFAVNGISESHLNLPFRRRAKSLFLEESQTDVASLGMVPQHIYIFRQSASSMGLRKPRCPARVLPPPAPLRALHRLRPIRKSLAPQRIPRPHALTNFAR